MKRFLSLSIIISAVVLSLTITAQTPGITIKDIKPTKTTNVKPKSNDAKPGFGFKSPNDTTKYTIKDNNKDNIIKLNNQVVDNKITAIVDTASFETDKIEIPEYEKVIYDVNNKEIRYKGYVYRMLPVGNCTYTMGATKEQGYDVADDELPCHRVSVFAFRMGETEVPQWLWTAVMGHNPSKNIGNMLPVENVSWNDCQQFIEKLSDNTEKKFMLPTEAQYELAARDGCDDNKYAIGISADLSDIAWHNANSSNQTHTVATKKPNSLGLYDIIGNVGEWCADWYGEYEEKSQTAPKGATNGTKKVYRSANYSSKENECRTAKRYAESPEYKSPSVGLRIVSK